MAESILTSTKKILGIVQSDTSFDVDVIMHLNTVFATLQQLGVGPQNGFSIADATANWEDYVGTDLALNQVKTYAYLRVRLLFDPPNTAYLNTAMKEQIQELEWRLNVHREGTAWVPPTPMVDNTYVLDGGAP